MKSKLESAEYTFKLITKRIVSQSVLKRAAIMMLVNSIASVSIPMTELNSLKTMRNELQARIEAQEQYIIVGL